MTAADLIEAIAVHRDFCYETLTPYEITDEVVIRIDSGPDEGRVFRVKVVEETE